MLDDIFKFDFIHINTIPAWPHPSAGEFLPPPLGGGSPA